MGGIWHKTGTCRTVMVGRVSTKMKLKQKFSTHFIKKFMRLLSRRSGWTATSRIVQWALCVTTSERKLTRDPSGNVTFSHAPHGMVSPTSSWCRWHHPMIGLHSTLVGRMAVSRTSHMRHTWPSQARDDSHRGCKPCYQGEMMQPMSVIIYFVDWLYARRHLIVGASMKVNGVAETCKKAGLVQVHVDRADN